MVDLNSWGCRNLRKRERIIMLLPCFLRVVLYTEYRTGQDRAPTYIIRKAG